MKRCSYRKSYWLLFVGIFITDVIILNGTSKLCIAEQKRTSLREALNKLQSNSDLVIIYPEGFLENYGTYKISTNPIKESSDIEKFKYIADSADLNYVIQDSNICIILPAGIEKIKNSIDQEKYSHNSHELKDIKILKIENTANNTYGCKNKNAFLNDRLEKGIVKINNLENGKWKEAYLIFPKNSDERECQLLVEKMTKSVSDGKLDQKEFIDFYEKGSYVDFKLDEVFLNKVRGNIAKLLKQDNNAEKACLIEILNLFIENYSLPDNDGQLPLSTSAASPSPT